MFEQFHESESPSNLLIIFVAIDRITNSLYKKEMTFTSLKHSF